MISQGLWSVEPRLRRGRLEGSSDGTAGTLKTGYAIADVPEITRHEVRIGSRLFARIRNELCPLFAASINYTDPNGEFPVAALLASCAGGAAMDVGMDLGAAALSGRKVTLGDIGNTALKGCASGFVGFGLGKALLHGARVFGTKLAASHADDFIVGTKHLPWARGNWSKFAEGVNPNQVLRDALTSPNRRFLPNDSRSFKVVTDLGRSIGTKGQTSIRAIVDYAGDVVTWFPVR